MQIIAENDQENIARGALVLAKGNAELLLHGRPGQDEQVQIIRDSLVSRLCDVADRVAGTAEEYLKQALESAERIGSRCLRIQSTTLLALLSELKGSQDDGMVERWHEASTGNLTEILGLRDEIRKVGEIVKLVGVRVAENWT